MTLATRDAPVKRIEVRFRDRFLALITDPNIAYILMMVGMLGIFFELSNPGVVLPGVIGGICLILAFFAFQSLPINWAGLLLHPVRGGAAHRGDQGGEPRRPHDRRGDRDAAGLDHALRLAGRHRHPRLVVRDRPHRGRDGAALVFFAVSRGIRALLPALGDRIVRPWSAASAWPATRSSRTGRCSSTASSGARSARTPGVPAGEPVRVAGIDGLTLTVTRSARRP